MKNPYINSEIKRLILQAAAEHKIFVKANAIVDDHVHLQVFAPWLFIDLHLGHFLRLPSRKKSSRSSIRKPSGQSSSQMLSSPNRAAAVSWGASVKQAEEEEWQAVARGIQPVQHKIVCALPAALARAAHLEGYAPRLKVGRR